MQQPQQVGTETVSTLAVCVYSGALAYNKFRQVTGRSYVSGE